MRTKSIIKRASFVHVFVCLLESMNLSTPAPKFRKRKNKRQGGRPRLLGLLDDDVVSPQCDL